LLYLVLKAALGRDQVTAPRSLRPVPDGSALAILLRAHRQKHGWTQAQAAEQIPASQQLVANWESGARPSSKYLPALAAYLGFDSVESLSSQLEIDVVPVPAAVQPMDRISEGVAARLAKGVSLSDDEVALINRLIDFHTGEVG
jgi:transcriptional regulator with XRE-family HTH domain